MWSVIGGIAHATNRLRLGTDVTAPIILESARIYTLPEELAPIYVAAGGTESAELAGRIGDG